MSEHVCSQGCATASVVRHFCSRVRPPLSCYITTQDERKHAPRPCKNSACSLVSRRLRAGRAGRLTHHRGLFLTFPNPPEDAKSRQHTHCTHTPWGHSGCLITEICACRPHDRFAFSLASKWGRTCCRKGTCYSRWRDVRENERSIERWRNTVSGQQREETVRREQTAGMSASGWKHEEMK